MAGSGIDPVNVRSQYEFFKLIAIMTTDASIERMCTASPLRTTPGDVCTTGFGGSLGELQNNKASSSAPTDRKE